MKLFFAFLLFGAFSTHGQKKEIILTAKAPQPIGPYSQAIKTGNTLYVAGQLGLTINGYIDSTSIESETVQALQNIKAILEAAHMSFKDVVKSTIYLTDLGKFKNVNEIYAGYFNENPPARETVEVKALPKGAHIEISVIAVK